MKMNQKSTKCCMLAVVTSNFVGNNNSSAAMNLIIMQKRKINKNKIRRDNKKVKLKLIKIKNEK